MKITDVEFIKIHVPLAERYRDKPVELRGIEHRVIAKVKTDNGLVGYGDIRVKPYWVPPDDSVIDRLIDRSPFDFINNKLTPELGSALYDVMGKYLEEPAHKLMGQKLRDAVAVAAWCPPFSAEDFAAEVQRAAGQGYMVFKMHTSPLYDPIEQTRTAEAVAPEGFQIHYDFNGSGRSMVSSLSVIKELDRNHPIVGFIEDPLPAWAIQEWQTLRQQTGIPIVMHVYRVGSANEIAYGMADAYMIGDGTQDYSIGDMLSRGNAYGRANVQTMVQVTGGTLTKALALHMASVLPTGTGHSINLDDQYEEDVTTERIPVDAGASPVPNRPGLGFEVDEEAIARFAESDPIDVPRYVGILHLPGDRKVYAADQRPGPEQVVGREEGTVRGIRSEIWRDDGSPEWERVYERARNDGPFRE